MRYIQFHIAALAAGYVLDLLIGDPHGIPHPVVWIGRFIAFLERKLYPGSRDARKEFRRGLLLVIVTALVPFLLTAALLAAAYRLNVFLGAALEAVLTCYILAARSLYDESMKVYRDLAAGETGKARHDLSMIVGRDTEDLDEAAVSRAAVETVAENASDGVIAPLLYTAAGGPALGILYKSVNTMDSMIGYHNERYEYFGRAAAKLDDIANYIPSRISALLMIAAAAFLGLFTADYSGRNAFGIWRRDRRNHKSPNSAQTESAAAGALGIRLGGPSRYKGVLSVKPYIGDAVRKIEAADIQRANRLMFAAEAFAAAAALLILAAALLLYK